MKNILLILIIFITGIGNVYADNFDEKFTDSHQIIGCWNDNLETKKPTNKGNCYWGKGRHNIILPPKRHLDIYKKVFNNDIKRIINSFPTENIESGFNPEANNSHAIGYVQTLRKFNIGLSIEEQLLWKITRQNRQKFSKKLCGGYNNENDTIKCLYRAHYHFYKGEYYSKKSMAIRQYYKNYFGIK